MRMPLHAEGTVTRPGHDGFRVTLTGEARGVLELVCVPGARLPRDLRIGEPVRVAFELARSVVTVEARVSARTGSSLRVAASTEPEEVPRRRHHPRTRLHLPVVVRLVRRDGRETTVGARMVDLSMGGCALKLDVVVPARAEVSVEATLGERVELTGRVVRPTARRSGTVGVRFGELPAGVQRVLQQFLHDARRHVA